MRSLRGDKYVSQLPGSRAGAAIVGGYIEQFDRPQLIVDDVDEALVKALGLFTPRQQKTEPGIHKTAIIGADAKIDASVYIGPYTIIEDEVQIDDNSIIGNNCTIGRGTKIGANTTIENNVVIYHLCTIGNNVVIQSNTCIGSVGYGFVQIKNMPVRVPHNGGVIIEDFVELGSCVTIDRAKFDNTIIGMGTKIDNQVHIAHNVIMGKCCLVVGQAGIAGSTKIGDGVILAGQVGVVDNVSIGNGAIVGAQGGVMNDLAAGKTYVGSPAIESIEKLRQVAATQKLPQMAKQFQKAYKKG